MSYVAGILQPGERVVKAGRLHWIIYKDAIVCLVLSMCLFWTARDWQESSTASMIAAAGGLILLVAALCFAVKARFDQWITEIAVTNLRVIYKRGFIRRHTAEMNMGKVESVVVTQSVLGRLLNYGSIHVRGTGEGMEHLHNIAAPIELRNCITGH